MTTRTGRLSTLRTFPLAMAAMFFMIAVVTLCAAEPDKKKEKKQDPFRRPAVSQPIKPTMPAANRFRTDRVFLEQADSLYRLPYEYEERQIVKGDVRFRQAGMWMYCDSAYYFPEKNSLEAFGNVRMRQGDTISVVGDHLFYDGDTRLARLRKGATARRVVMKDGDVTLITDSLEYDLAAETGWYDCGGELNDGTNTLVSVYGRYSTATKDADFYKDVVLTNVKDGYTLLTDTLYYNTGTHIARIETPTEIRGENDTILTTHGWYDTERDVADLTSRSTVMHRDSTGAVTTLEGDSILYDKATRISRAYSFRSPGKLARPTVLTDTANKAQLIGGFAMYDGIRNRAEATDYPMLIEYSRPDTIFLRADTIRMYIDTVKVRKPVEIPATDSLKVLTDSIGVSADSISVAADSISVPTDKSALPADTSGVAADSVMKNDMAVNAPDTTGQYEMREFKVAQAFRHARFFKSDMQGVADSIVYTECDSLLRMFVKPVVWSEERQVTGEEILVHLNDSTSDYASLPKGGMMVEHVEEEFYNQLSGRKMMAYFSDGSLKRLEVDGNVETIFVPMESDSTYNRIVSAESAFMTVEMDSNVMRNLKMWPDVSGTVTPIFLVNKNLIRLRGFVWLEDIRPVRGWYGNQIRWIDELGEIPEKLLEYLRRENESSIQSASSSETLRQPDVIDGDMPVSESITTIEEPNLQIKDE